MGDLSVAHILATAIVIFLAIGLHEYAHCKIADMAGDPTPRLMGRVTLDLTKHFELMGTIMIIVTSLTGFGIGWGKAAPCNPSKMRNPRWDHFMTVAAGPLSNVLQACIWAILFRLILTFIPGVVPQDSFLFLLFLYGVIINLALALFNMIPLGPLDGHWLVGLLMPESMRVQWFQFNQSVGAILFLVLIFGDQFLRQSTGFSILGDLVFGPALFLARFLLGGPI